MQIATYPLWVMALVGEGYGKIQVSGSVRYNNNGNEEKKEAEKKKKRIDRKDKHGARRLQLHGKRRIYFIRSGFTWFRAT